MYTLNFKEQFVKAVKKQIKGNQVLETKLKKTLIQLAQDPNYNSLNSHKVDTVDQIDVWSSWITGDLRIIWNYSQDKIEVIDVLTLGGHSGGKKVYK